MAKTLREQLSDAEVELARERDRYRVLNANFEVATVRQDTLAADAKNAEARLVKFKEQVRDELRTMAAETGDWDKANALLRSIGLAELSTDWSVQVLIKFPVFNEVTAAAAESTARDAIFDALDQASIEQLTVELVE